MINVKDLHKVYEERMSEKDKNIVREFESFIDEQLIETDGKSKFTKWDFLMIVDKAIGGLTDKDYIVYKKAFECVEIRLKGNGEIVYDRYAYTKEATLLRYMLKRYYDNGYLIRYCFESSNDRIIYIEK